MAVDYNDARFQQVNNEKNQALAETRSTYDQMINNSDAHFQRQIDASKDYEKKQTELQQAQTDLAIEKINQQKQQTEQDYIKEQKAAYTDYQKASNQYGVNAEKMATQGLTNTGYSESAKTSMFNTYQNRYSTARDTYNRAILNFDNGIKDAMLANSSALAKIAYDSLQQQLSLGLQQFQYKNELIQQKLTAVNETEDRYYGRWKDVLSQINTENALAEQIRQHNEQMALQREQFEWQKSQAASRSSGGSSRSSGRSSGGSSGAALTESNPYGTALNVAQGIKKIVGSKTADSASRNVIDRGVQAGKISIGEANALFDRYNL
jgi:hypothetical protein